MNQMISFSEEELEAMNAFMDRIKELIQNCPYPILWFVSVTLPDNSGGYWTNGCSACMVEDIINWVKENNIQHMSEKESKPKVH